MRGKSEETRVRYTVYCQWFCFYVLGTGLGLGFSYGGCFLVTPGISVSLLCMERTVFQSLAVYLTQKHLFFSVSYFFLCTSAFFFCFISPAPAYAIVSSFFSFMDLTASFFFSSDI